MAQCCRFVWATSGGKKPTADGSSSAVALCHGVVGQRLGLGRVFPEVVLCEEGARLPFTVVVRFAALVRFRVDRFSLAVVTSLLRGGVAAVRRFGQLEGELESYASRTWVGVVAWMDAVREFACSTVRAVFLFVWFPGWLLGGFMLCGT